MTALTKIYHTIGFVLKNTYNLISKENVPDFYLTLIIDVDSTNKFVSVEII